MNDHQLKFIHALTKQILRASQNSESNKSDKHNSPKTHVTVQPPRNNKYPLARQGPFLFQPAPRDLGGIEEEADATDVIYLEVGAEGRDDDPDSEKLGALAIAYQDGRVDICLDTEKVEARWELETVGLYVATSQA
jgi:nucleoporin NUP82